MQQLQIFKYKSEILHKNTQMYTLRHALSHVIARVLFLSLYFHWPVRPTTTELIYLSWWPDTDTSLGPTVSKVGQPLLYKHSWTQRHMQGNITTYQQQAITDHLSLLIG